MHFSTNSCSFLPLNYIPNIKDNVLLKLRGKKEDNQYTSCLFISYVFVL